MCIQAINIYDLNIHLGLEDLTRKSLEIRE